VLLNRDYEGAAFTLRPRVEVFVQAAAAVAVAKSKSEMLVVRVEAARLAKAYPAEASAADLMEFMIRLALRQRVPVEIG